MTTIATRLINGRQYRVNQKGPALAYLQVLAHPGAKVFRPWVDLAMADGSSVMDIRNPALHEQFAYIEYDPKIRKYLSRTLDGLVIANAISTDLTGSAGFLDVATQTLFWWAKSFHDNCGTERNPK